MSLINVFAIKVNVYSGCTRIKKTEGRQKKFQKISCNQEILMHLNQTDLNSNETLMRLDISCNVLLLEANQNKNSCLLSNFCNKLKFPVLFSVRNGWEKCAGDFNLSQKPFFTSPYVILHPPASGHVMFCYGLPRLVMFSLIFIDLLRLFHPIASKYVELDHVVFGHFVTFRLILPKNKGNLLILIQYDNHYKIFIF